MPAIYQGVLTLLFVFCLCFGIAFILRFIYLYSKFLKSEKQARQDPKIYYITNTVNERKKRRRAPRKKVDVALKGVVLRPEEFDDMRGR